MIKNEFIKQRLNELAIPEVVENEITDPAEIAEYDALFLEK